MFLQCPLPIKILYHLTIMVLLDCCEFNLNVSCMRINACSRIVMPLAAMPVCDGRLRAVQSGDALANWEKMEGGVLIHEMIRYKSKTEGISLG